MTKQQFDSLKVGDSIKVVETGGTITSTTNTKVRKIHTIQGIVTGTFDHEVFRYENCELVLKDELVEYLKNMSNTPSTDAELIRQIVRKEVIDGLKFPSEEDLLYATVTGQLYEYIVNEIKRLNS